MCETPGVRTNSSGRRGTIPLAFMMSLSNHLELSASVEDNFVETLMDLTTAAHPPKFSIFKGHQN